LRPLVFSRRQIHHRAQGPRDRAAMLHPRPGWLSHRGRADDLDSRSSGPLRVTPGDPGAALQSGSKDWPISFSTHDALAVPGPTRSDQATVLDAGFMYSGLMTPQPSQHAQLLHSLALVHRALRRSLNSIIQVSEQPVPEHDRGDFADFIERFTKFLHS